MQLGKNDAHYGSAHTLRLTLKTGGRFRENVIFGVKLIPKM